MSASRADVQIQKNEDGHEDEVAFFVKSHDGKALTGQQIIEAISEALILYWDHMPMEERTHEEFDA